MQKSLIIRGLPAAVNESCNEIHSHLQTITRSSTLFVSCINPSIKITVVSIII